jgi:PAS domain S-box-containing protein
MSNKRAHPEVRTLKGGLRSKAPGKSGAPQKSHTSPGPSLRKQPMDKLPPSAPPDLQPRLQARIQARLKTAEETLSAIQSGEVDAVMVSGPHGDRVASLKGGEPSYRMLVEAMSEGAATLSRDGAVLYCNGRFAELIGKPPAKMIGVAVQSLVAETEQDRFGALLADSQKAVAKGEFNLRSTCENLIPVYLSLNRFRGFKGQALGMVITDLSEQKRVQAAEIKQAEATRRLLLEHTLSAQEEERRRIARELHDEAGQLLTALLVGLRTMEDTRKLADVKIQGHRLREIATQAIDEVGRLARGLHPTVLDDHGLGVALSRYAAEYTKTHDIAVNLALCETDSCHLSSAVQITLYRILQEAMTNVARHSGAKSVSIQFTCTATSVEVAVIDDGCGFDAKAVAVSSQRLGIQSMRERAAMLGGTLSFTSPRKGTKILVQVPLANQPLMGKRGA